MKSTSLIVICLVCFVFVYVGYIKVLGSQTELSTPISKQGYCKLTYGDDFRYNTKTEKCFNGINSKENYEFDLEGFEIDCVKPSLLSPHFYNKCFYANKHDSMSR